MTTVTRTSTRDEIGETWVSQKEAAELLGRTQARVSQLARSGRLTSRPAGRNRVLIARSSIRELLRQRLREAEKVISSLVREMES